MTAGVPGLGLSGLFVLLSVILMPMRWSRRPVSRPVRMMPLLAMGAAIVATIWLSWEFLMPRRATESQVSGNGAGQAASGPLDALAMTPVILISLGIVVSIVVAVELLSHLVDTRPTPTDPPVTRVSCGVSNG